MRRQIRQSDFEAAALPHLNDLYRTAARLLGETSNAEDVVQDVYLQAWKSFDRFEAGTNCRAWLFQILFNSIRHYRRKWLNQKLVQPGDGLLDQTVAPIVTPDRLTDAEILTALDQIPPDFRAVVLLTDVDEFAYKEVAGILGIPIGTVMSRLSRGRK